MSAPHRVCATLGGFRPPLYDGQALAVIFHDTSGEPRLVAAPTSAAWELVSADALTAQAIFHRTRELAWMAVPAGWVSVVQLDGHTVASAEVPELKFYDTAGVLYAACIRQFADGMWMYCDRDDPDWHTYLAHVGHAPVRDFPEIVGPR